MILVNNVRTSRRIWTLFGKITYERTFLIAQNAAQSKLLFETEGVHGIFPKDCALGVDRLPFKATHQMITAIAREGTRANSYADAANNIFEKYHDKISAKQVERITNYVGSVVWLEQCGEALVAKDSIGNKIDNRKRRRRNNDILYIEIDGAHVHIRDKSVGNHKKDGWTESKHAIAFHSTDIHYWEKRNSDGELCHRINRKDCIGYIGEAEEFKYHLIALAKRNDCDRVSEVVFICDGAIWIKEIVEKYFPYATYILDLYHAKEHAGCFAKQVKSNAVEAKEFADSLCDLMEESRINDLLSILKPYENYKMPEGMTNLYTYVKNHYSGMDYRSFREKGYFVGSGAIESANRYLMQNRMKLPGMRWNKDAAQRMLSLKVREESGQWDQVVNMMEKHFFGRGTV